MAKSSFCMVWIPKKTLIQAISKGVQIKMSKRNPEGLSLCAKLTSGTINLRERLAQRWTILLTKMYIYCIDLFGINPSPPPFPV